MNLLRWGNPRKCWRTSRVCCPRSTRRLQFSGIARSRRSCRIRAPGEGITAALSATLLDCGHFLSLHEPAAIARELSAISLTLACISQTLSTAARDKVGLCRCARSPCSRARAPYCPSTPPRAERRAPRIRSLLTRRATKRCEKFRLTAGASERFWLFSANFLRPPS